MLAKSVKWFNVVGTGYIKLLQMIVIPLVFISILGAFTKVTIGKNFGKMAGMILGILVGTTAIAAVIGISASLLFGLDASEIVQGEAEAARGASMEERSASMADKDIAGSNSWIYSLEIRFLTSREHVRHRQSLSSSSRRSLDLRIWRSEDGMKTMRIW